MKSLIVFAIVAVAYACAGPVSSDDSDNVDMSEQEFEEKISHRTTDSEAQRLKWAVALGKSEMHIKQHNKNKSGTFFFLNPMSNVPEDEMQDFQGLVDDDEDEEEEERAMGLIEDPEDRASEYSEHFWQSVDNIASSKIKANYDGRLKRGGQVSPVKSQGGCGSCVAFATAAVVETCIYIATGATKHVDLSEMYFVDCANGEGFGNGCSGASFAAYLKFLAKMRGGLGNMPLESKYPYTPADRSYVCKATKPSDMYKAGAYVKHAHWYGDGDETASNMRLKKLIYKYGAVIISLYASDPSFRNYKSGIYSGCTWNPKESKRCNHAVALVGWGKKDGHHYWIIKNSWGTKWGENGFMKIRQNTCGIGRSVAVPVCAKYN